MPAEPPADFETAFAQANDLLYRHTSRAETAFRELLKQQYPEQRSRRARLLERLCIATRILGDYPEATQLGDEAMSLFESIGDDAGLGRTCIARGNIEWSRGDMDTALAYYESALEIRRKLDDPKALAGALGSVANILSELNRLDEALQHYEEALALSEQLDDAHFAARTHNNLGECLLLTGQLDSAMMHCQEALRLCRAMGDRADEPNVLINMGRIRGAEQRWQDALDLLDEAAAAAVIGEDRRTEAEAMMHRAKLTEERGRIVPFYLGLAGLYREQALELATAVGALPLIEQIHTMSAEAAEHVGNKEAAARHWAALSELRQRG